MLEGEEAYLQAASQAKLPHDPAEVVLHGLLTDPQTPGDLLVAQALGHVSDNLQLSECDGLLIRQPDCSAVRPGAEEGGKPGGRSDLPRSDGADGLEDLIWLRALVKAASGREPKGNQTALVQHLQGLVGEVEGLGAIPKTAQDAIIVGVVHEDQDVALRVVSRDRRHQRFVPTSMSDTHEEYMRAQPVHGLTYVGTLLHESQEATVVCVLHNR